MPIKTFTATVTIRVHADVPDHFDADDFGGAFDMLSNGEIVSREGFKVDGVHVLDVSDVSAVEDDE